MGIKQAIFFCGDLRRDELPDILKEGGVEINELVVYETKLTPVKVSMRYDGILFFSPSAIKSFFTLNELPSKTVLFSIGETTRATLMDFTDHKIISIDKPNKEDLVRLALQYFETPMIH
ncbi:MAG TPA: uroporphyrinogen-III synthase [Puia sp.]|nr:uroporphyrinogen-III synthase [Puia sp.]